MVTAGQSRFQVQDGWNVPDKALQQMIDSMEIGGPPVPGQPYLDSS